MRGQFDVTFLGIEGNMDGSSTGKVRIVLPNGLALTVSTRDSVDAGCWIDDFSDMMSDGRTRMEHFMAWRDENETTWADALRDVQRSISKVASSIKRYFAIEVRS